MNKITKFLNSRIDGQAYDRPNILKAYSRDRSILEITPRVVAIPETAEDVQFLVRCSNELAEKDFELPVVVRGSGLDKTGADLGEGLVISTEKLNLVQEVDDRSRLVRVQAGVTVEKLNAVLAAYNLTLPLKVNPKETIGGLISNFPIDGIAKKYGGIYYFTDRIEAVLSNGDLYRSVSYTYHGLNNVKKQDSFEGMLYRDTDKLIENKFDKIDDIRHSVRSISGYHMITRVKNEERKTFDLMPLFFGAQGTLGVITEVILKVEPILRERKHILANFQDIKKAIDFANNVHNLEPVSCDLFDARIFKISESHGKDLEIVKSRDEGFYVLVAFDDAKFIANRKIKSAMELGMNANSIIAENVMNTDEFKQLDTLFPLYANDESTSERPFILDDIRLPQEDLAAFIEDLKSTEKLYDQDLPIFGSMETSLYNLRPSFDLSDVDMRKKAIEFIIDITKLAISHHGAIAGGCAEGRVKGLATTKIMPDYERKIYEEIKKTFDPHNILNPEAKLGASINDVVCHIRKTSNIGVK